MNQNNESGLLPLLIVWLVLTIAVTTSLSKPNNFESKNRLYMVQPGLFYSEELTSFISKSNF